MEQLSFSIIITNWRRQKNIPNIVDRWSAQNYPKDKVEIIIIDDNSPNKKEVFEVVRDILLSHRDLDIRFFETYKNITYNPALRYNIGVRQAKNEVIILNESDILVQGLNYLSMANEEHVKDDKLWLCPRVLTWEGEPSNLVEERRSVRGVTDCDLGASIRRENYFKAGGCDENLRGWGGLENRFSRRRKQVGIHEKQNRNMFVIHCKWNCMGWNHKPPDHAKPSSDKEWLTKPKIVRKKDEWGLLDTLKELRLEDLV